MGGVRGRHPQGPACLPPGSPHARREDGGVHGGRGRGASLTSEGGPAPLDSGPRHVKAHVGAPAAGHFMGRAVQAVAVGHRGCLVLLEGGWSGMAFGGRDRWEAQTRQRSPVKESRVQADVQLAPTAYRHLLCSFTKTPQSSEMENSFSRLP